MTDGESKPEGSEEKAGEEKTSPQAQTPPPGQTPPPEQTSNGAPEDMTVGELVFEISDRASVLVREEIELAKAEVTEKVNSLLRGSVTALAAGVFILLALAMVMHGIAWLINDLFFDNFWAGFLIEAGIFLLIAAGAGFYAYRSFKKGAPPTPDMAIEEAKEIASALDGEGSK
jgi:uncharacterized membrane protein YqjE